MTDNFFRFPSTPHIQWLGQNEPRGDKLLNSSQIKSLLSHSLTIEEKIDGANIGFSVAENGQLQAQNRGAWIERDAGGQFKHLWKWLKPHEDDLIELLGSELILFGEWCYAKHSLAYDHLPDWFIGFDIYCKSSKAFYSVARRNELLNLLGLEAIRPIAERQFSIDQLIGMLNVSSQYGAKRLEGIYLRQDNRQWLNQRAKLVRSDFTQTIEQHWSKQPLMHNCLQSFSD
ncbi:RNA ligase family protein [Pelagibaculum spongiae]|uniref:RNA ligase domain-containing protein n=1 Tax=Pelagibaculum spongiae TaxID=2080658 RepID=A0A2V1GWE8_9GAMM|nr:RNA ligase family protein [Pelagibaculum spongiae]PVZ70658.1 hypothetical protein DC094_08775 [Pelagibaculum spongiae]